MSAEHTSTEQRVDMALARVDAAEGLVRTAVAEAARFPLDFDYVAFCDLAHGELESVVRSLGIIRACLEAALPPEARERRGTVQA